MDFNEVWEKSADVAIETKRLDVGRQKRGAASF